MKTPSKDFLVVMALIGSLVIASFIWNPNSKPPFSHTKAGYVHRELFDISHAIKSYQFEFKEDPPTPLKEFFASLEGVNPKKIRFLISSRYEDPHTKLRCDAWHTPYQVFKGSSGWLIRSAGPNQAFDDIRDAYAGKQSDDITMLIPPVTQ